MQSAVLALCIHCRVLSVQGGWFFFLLPWGKRKGRRARAGAGGGGVLLLVVVLGAGSAGREKRGSRHGLMGRVPRVQGVRSGGERRAVRFTRG